jgi:hypothetical protein
MSVAIRFRVAAASFVLFASIPLESGYPQTERPPTGTVEGSVVDSTTGEVLSDVELSLGNLESVLATSDADGRFVLAGVPAGSIGITFFKGGYAPFNANFSVESDRTTTPATVRLDAVGVITGTVLDPRGTPAVEEAVSALYRRIRSDGTVEWVTGAAGLTNDLGEFRLFDVAPGEYVVAYSNPYAIGTNAIAGNPHPNEYPRFLYPGVDRISDATVIHVRSGEVTRLGPVLIEQARFGTLRIHVSNPGREPAKEVTFRCCVPPPMLPNGGDVFAGLVTGGVERETARMDPGEMVTRAYWPIRPGTYAFPVQWPNAIGKTSVVTAFIPFHGADLDVPVTLDDPDGRLLVLAVVETLGAGEPLGRVSVNLGPLALYYEERDAPARGMSQSDTGRFPDGILVVDLADDGRGSVEGIPPGRYDLREVAGAPRDLYLASARHAGTVIRDEALFDGVDVSERESTLELTFRPSAATIRGRVTSDAEVVPDAFLLLEPQGRPAEALFRGFHRTARADQQGSFEISGIAPGDYLLYAWSREEYPPLRFPSHRHLDPDFMGRFAGRGIAIAFDENDRVDVGEVELRR